MNLFCPMNCSKGGRHAHVGVSRRLHATLKCCWKRKVLSTCAKALTKKGCRLTMSLSIMIEVTRAQFPK